MTALELAGEFPIADRGDWVEAVEKVLRGRSFEKVLVSRTRDGLEVAPLYTAEDITATQIVAPADRTRLERGWDVRQVHDGSNPASCARSILAELERGVTSVELTAPAGGWTADDLAEATDGVLFDLAPIVLAPHVDVDAARALHTLIGQQGSLASTGSWLGLDPLGAVARGATAPAEVSAVIGAAADLAATLPLGRTTTVDTARYTEAGATDAQAIGWSIATAVAYLRAFEEAGLAPGAAASTIAFRLAVGQDQFVTIASLRAARRVWARVLEASGVEPDARQQHIQAVTSRSMYSRRDPWVNMLRATTAALAAGVGGADAVTVLPFDDAIGAPDPFARRVARNTQLLLLEESHLARVVDPAAGSWFVESLTARLAAAAWEVLQETEKAGGMASALESGRVRAAIDESWQVRLSALGTRRDPITGVSEFPDLDEAPLDRPARTDESGYPVRRVAAPFEALRDASDRALAAHGQRPTVHLAALGTLATHTARSTWITNLLAAGGVAAEGGDRDGSMSPLEAEARFTESGAAVAVICSSDAVYAERAASTATALREAGALRVILAGAPGELRDELEAAGVDEFWHVGIDVLDALTRLHADLGVEPGDKP